jgi:uncharacterized secreted protein with C-terminal beta-propeller domain
VFGRQEWSVEPGTFSNPTGLSDPTAIRPVRIVPGPAPEIVKFHLGVHEVSFAAAGKVEGLPLNSYSMDEYEGKLRVVTTRTATASLTGNLVQISLSPVNDLYVLSEADGKLTVTGSVTNIGVGERVQSVLFKEDRAYVVTFRQVDPLFAINLGDPANPVVEGELVVPGFSSYLYAIDREHLIGVGQVMTSGVQNVQVSLFNVADLAHPVAVDQDVYRSGWTTSGAQYDPHAFSWFADQEVLAIPLDTWGTDNSTRNNLLVLQVDADTGITELGRVSHSTRVLRSLRIGEYLYSLAEGDLKIVELMNPTDVVADVMLPPTTTTTTGVTILPILIGPITTGPIIVLNAPQTL